jgi:hypothetical protein
VLKIEYRHLAEILGITGVIASMVFVGMELRQSQEIAIAGQYQARATNQQDYFLTNLELAEDEQSIQGLRLSWLISSYDNAHFQYELGYIDEETWQGFSNRVRSRINTEFSKEYFEARKTYYRASFVELIESLMLETP